MFWWVLEGFGLGGPRGGAVGVVGGDGGSDPGRRLMSVPAVPVMSCFCLLLGRPAGGRCSGCRATPAASPGRRGLSERYDRALSLPSTCWRREVGRWGSVLSRRTWAGSVSSGGAFSGGWRRVGEAAPGGWSAFLPVFAWAGPVRVPVICPESVPVVPPEIGGSGCDGKRRALGVPAGGGHCWGRGRLLRGRVDGVLQALRRGDSGVFSHWPRARTVGVPCPGGGSGGSGPS